jgi:DNA-binding SARP family transcriptional activator
VAAAAAGVHARRRLCDARVARGGTRRRRDWYDDWVILARERFRQARLHALEALCLSLASSGRYAEAAEAGLAAVAGEPLRESAHRALIQAHLAQGNPGEAIRQYRLCRRLLHEQLGLEPSPQLDELVGALPV